jgi:hypothetical protein
VGGTAQGYVSLVKTGFKRTVRDRFIVARNAHKLASVIPVMVLIGDAFIVGMTSFWEAIIASYIVLAGVPGMLTTIVLILFCRLPVKWACFRA